MIRTIRCKWCKLEIVCVDETLTVYHQVPECEAFAAAVKDHEGSDGVLVDRGLRPIAKGSA